MAMNGNANHAHLHPEMDNDTALRQIRTAGSISISPELFEKIYLNPQNTVKGDLRKTFANPTPICLIGFLMSLTPLTCDLMGWRGASNGAANIGAFYGFGTILMVVGGILEWVLGNTFSAVVFTSFGGFWFSLASTLVPSFNAYGAYSPNPSQPAGGLASASFAASFAFFFLWMGFLCLIYAIAALRTNVVFVVIFLTLVVAFGLLSAQYWYLSQGRTAYAGNMAVGAGACLFLTCVAGWYLFFIQVLAAVDFPLTLPVGDLSTMIKGAADRRRAKDPGHSV